MPPRNLAKNPRSDNVMYPENIRKLIKNITPKSELTSDHSVNPDITGSKYDIINSAVFTLQKKLPKIDPGLIAISGDIIDGVVSDASKKSWHIPICALESYVDWLYLHSVDVSLLSVVISVKAGFSGIDLRRICLGALLHDLGKLIIPDSIIQKPGRLNDREMSLMRRHCELGYNMAMNFNLPDECRNIILQHHERLDGSGYPKGLSKNELPESAKIVMIADVLDAITSFRPYKKARTMCEGITVLKREPLSFEQKYVNIVGKYL